MITVIFSPQSKMVKGPLKKSIKEFLPEHDDLNYVTLDMATSKLLDLSNECLSLPIGYDKKAVIADNFHYLAKTREKKKMLKGDDDGPFLEFLKDPDPSILLYILVYCESLDEGSKYFEALKKSGAAFKSVALLNDEEWKNFIPSYLSKRGAKIEVGAVDELVRRVGGDYSSYMQECAKLINYSNGETITKAMVMELVAAPLEDDAFALSNALTRGEKGKAVAIYRNMKTKAKSANAITLMNMLFNQFLFLDEVRYLYNLGYEANDISAELKCSTGRAKACMYSIKKMRNGSIRKAINELYGYESAIFSGSIDDGLAFELFLANYEM